MSRVLNDIFLMQLKNESKKSKCICKVLLLSTEI